MRRLALALGAAAVALATAPAALASHPAPAAPDLDTASDSGSLTTDNITSDTTPTFTVNAGAAQATMTVTIYALSANAATGSLATAVASATVPSSGVATVTVPAATALADGVLTITAKTRDGGSVDSAASLALALTVDSTAPVLARAPELIDFVGSNAALTFTGTPRFGVIAESATTVQLFEGTGALGSGTAGDDGTVEIRSGIVMSDASHTVYAVATDLAGNVSGQSPTLVFRVDTVPPAVQPALLAAGTSTTEPRPTFTVTTEVGARVTIFENGVALGSAVASGSVTATVRVGELLWLEPGEHCVVATAMDDVGNTSTETDETCFTVEAGAAPFTTNLGVDLAADQLSLSVETTLAADATFAIVRGGKTVATVRRAVRAGTSKVRLKLPSSLRKAKRLVVVATLRSADERAVVIRRSVRRRG